MNKALHDSIEIIESGYEYLLAYAAQGRETDQGAEVRQKLEDMSKATGAVIESLDGNSLEFAAVVVDDARKSLAAIALVLGQPQISSEITDNLNASIHLRALLTGLFLLSEAGV